MRTRKKILIVDDDPDLCYILQTVFEHLGYDSVVAVNGKEAVDLATSQLPDLILMDINLPGMSGIEAMARLRANPDTREIPVIGLSANAMPNDIRHGLAAGFRRYLTKPIRIGEVLEAIDAVTREEADSP